MSQKKYRTSSGIDIKELYQVQDLDPKLADRTGKPGHYPFTRGIHPNMYRGKPWTMRQYAGFGSADDTNKRYKFLLKQGITGLSVAFDLPTQMGRDPDHPLAKGEVGKVGVSIATIDDMERLLAEIPLDQVSISMTINATAAILLAMLLVVAQKRGIPWNKLKGTIQNDVLKEYIARGTYIYPPKQAMRIVTDIFAFCAQEVPQWNTISVSGYHIREAGSTAVEELAFTMADGIAYVEAALAKGLEIDDFAPRVAFFFNCHNNFFEEVAKFRAARRLWARIMKERFSAKDPKSMMLRFHTQTAGSTLTADQPMNNVVRTSLQALAAVLGGTQSLHTNSFDEALGLPTEESAQLALRTQQIIAEESGVVASVDPLGGSYLVESLTDALEKEVESKIAKIDAIGGMVKAIESGYPQREIESSAYEAQRAIELGESVVVGVNKFADTITYSAPVLKIDQQVQREQVENIERLKTERNKALSSEAISNLVSSANNNDNLMPAILRCVRQGCTLGEISDGLRGVFGEYR